MLGRLYNKHDIETHINNAHPQHCCFSSSKARNVMEHISLVVFTTVSIVCCTLGKMQNNNPLFWGGIGSIAILGLIGIILAAQKQHMIAVWNKSELPALTDTLLGRYRQAQQANASLRLTNERLTTSSIHMEI
jgi:hypothetical protein